MPAADRRWLPKPISFSRSALTRQEDDQFSLLRVTKEIPANSDTEPRLVEQRRTTVKLKNSKPWKT
jgi:hypothetical protein